MKKALVLFRNGSDIDLVLKSYQNLHHSFGFDIVPIFINDIAYSIPVKDTIMGSGIADRILEEMNQQFYHKIVQKFKEYGIEKEIITETGLTHIILKEHLKYCDLLILNQEFLLDDLFVDILKTIFRPVIILRHKPLTFDKIAIAANDGVKVNISSFNYLNLFQSTSIEDINIVSWNFYDSQMYLKRLIHDKGYNPKGFPYSERENTLEQFFDFLNSHDLVIMGNLSRSFFFEKITNRMGVNLLENINTNLFIG